MEDAEVEGAAQRGGASVGDRLEDADLAVLVSPEDFLVESDGDLRLVRHGGHRAELHVRRRLGRAFLDEFGARMLREGDDLRVAEEKRLASGQGGDG